MYDIKWFSCYVYYHTTDDSSLSASLLIFHRDRVTMPLQTTVYNGQSTAQPENPILSFYRTYALEFKDSRSTAKPSDFYAPNSVLTNIDNTTITGAQAIWDYYIQLYGPFQVEHEVVSITVVTDTESGNNTLNGEFLTILARRDGKGTVKIPQAFVYEIREAEVGQGVGGLQIWAVRCYYDRSLLKEAAGL